MTKAELIQKITGNEVWACDGCTELGEFPCCEGELTVPYNKSYCLPYTDDRANWHKLEDGVDHGTEVLLKVLEDFKTMPKAELLKYFEIAQSRSGINEEDQDNE